MALEVKTLKNIPVDSNCFVVFDKAVSYSCLLVDPGTEDCKEVFSFLETEALQPEYIILTHEHFDHIWGVERVRSKYNCKLISSRVCSELITVPKKNLSLFYNQKEFSCLPADWVVEDLMNPFVWNTYDIYFYNTLGHSEGSICIAINNCLFTGDTLLQEVETPTKLPGGSAAKLKNSLDFILGHFSNSMIVFPGHGDKFQLSEYVSCGDR